jgi:hypothetical protein
VQTGSVLSERMELKKRQANQKGNDILHVSIYNYTAVTNSLLFETALNDAYAASTK